MFSHINSCADPMEYDRLDEELLCYQHWFLALFLNDDINFVVIMGPTHWIYLGCILLTFCSLQFKFDVNLGWCKTLSGYHVAINFSVQVLLWYTPTETSNHQGCVCDGMMAGVWGGVGCVGVSVVVGSGVGWGWWGRGRGQVWGKLYCIRMY